MTQTDRIHTQPHPGDSYRFARDHVGELLRSTRRFTNSTEDGEDAVQRALEIMVRKGPALEQEWALSYLKVVARHEAFAIRRSNARTEPLDGFEPDRLEDRHGVSSDELCERIDSKTRASRDLPRLKHDERRALGLLAAGLSYGEICARTGWSYTKVNRCISEGRARLRRLERERLGAVAA